MSSAPPARVEHSAVLRRMAHWGAVKGPEAIVRFGPRPIGLVFGLALADVRRLVVRNLRRIYGQRSVLREQLDALSTIGNYAACFAEAMGAAREGLTPTVRVEGQKHLEAALAQGGVVLVTAHIGPWELTAQLLRTQLQADVIIVMEPEPNAEARELQDRWRSERGLRILHVGAHPMDALPLIAHLKRGGIAALQLDRVPPSGRVLEVEMLGAPFQVPEGPFRLAALSGSQVVPVFARRAGYFDYELSVGAPLALARRAGPAELQAAAQRAASAMAEFVRSSPTQWFHFVQP